MQQHRRADLADSIQVRFCKMKLHFRMMICRRILFRFEMTTSRDIAIADLGPWMRPGNSTVSRTGMNLLKFMCTVTVSC